MIKRVASAIVVALFIVAGVALFRTVQLSHDVPDIGPVAQHDFDEEAAVERLSQAIQFRTVSPQDPADMEVEEFEGWISFIESAYPALHETLERERINEYTLLYRWDGTNPDLKPGMMMGHYDVVPVEENTAAEWAYPPYSGAIADGYIWGRGTLDDKGGLMSTLEAVEYLAASGFEPERTMYFAANHDEEVGGHEGASIVADTLEARGTELAFLVDEGLPVAEEIIEGIESPLAMIGVAEKGQVTLELSIVREGGHASMPPRETAIGELARAVRSLKDNPMPGRFADLVQSTFDPVSPELPFVYRAALANLWLARPIIERQLSRIPHTNAALRTTIAPTIFRAGMKTNVLPARAETIINFRIHPNDTVESVIEHVESTIENPNIKIEKMEGARNASGVSDTEAVHYQRLKRSIWETFDEIPIAPSIFVAATDTRHFLDLTDNIYRFRPIRATPDDRGRIHGTDERVGIGNYVEMVQFQIRALHNMTEANPAE